MDPRVGTQLEQELGEPSPGQHPGLPTRSSRWPGPGEVAECRRVLVECGRSWVPSQAWRWGRGGGVLSALAPHCAASAHGSGFPAEGCRAQGWPYIWTFGLINRQCGTFPHRQERPGILASPFAGRAEVRCSSGWLDHWASLLLFHNELISPKVQLLGSVIPPLCSLSFPTRGKNTQLSFIDHLCYAHVSL